MRSLRELEADAQMAVPRDAGSAIKAWKNGTAGAAEQQLAWQFVIRELAGVGKLSFAIPDDPAVMGWRQGRQFVGLQLETIAETPMEDPQTIEPPARTMTERVARRARGKG
jgi:hypothetical protein